MRGNAFQPSEKLALGLGRPGNFREPKCPIAFGEWVTCKEELPCGCAARVTSLLVQRSYQETRSERITTFGGYAQLLVRGRTQFHLGMVDPELRRDTGLARCAHADCDGIVKGKRALCLQCKPGEANNVSIRSNRNLIRRCVRPRPTKAYAPPKAVTNVLSLGERTRPQICSTFGDRAETLLLAWTRAEMRRTRPVEDLSRRIHSLERRGDDMVAKRPTCPV